MQDTSLENLNTVSESLRVNSDKLKHHSDENEGISYCRGEFAKNFRMICKSIYEIWLYPSNLELCYQKGNDALKK